LCVGCYETASGVVVVVRGRDQRVRVDEGKFAVEKVCFAKVVVANKKVKCMLNF
jgi:hypothetical protein